MIVSEGTTKQGQRLLVVGITQEILDDLHARGALRVDLSKYLSHLQITLMLVAGDDDDKVLNVLRQYGVVDHRTEIVTEGKLQK